MNAQKINNSSGRVTVRPAVAEILASSEVWDMTLPWTVHFQDISILRRFKAAGYTFVSATTEDTPRTFEGILKCIQDFKEAAKAEADWLTVGTSLAEIDQGRREGKLVVGLNVQDTVQLGTDVSRVGTLYALGVRHMLLAYNVRNLVADGCAEPADAGLSIFGRQVVREMHRVGMVVDLTHTGRRSTLDAIEISERPTIFSHSGAYAVCAHIRNIHDEQIHACAARGGVVGVVGIGAYIGDAQARPETVFRHIDHIASLVGPQHVGLGADYVQDMQSVWDAMRDTKDSMWPDPTGTQLYEGDCYQPEQLAELVELMLAHGYSVDAVKGILGANFRRVYAMAEVPSGTTARGAP